MTSGYNGWANYETWAVKLWIDNDEGSYNYWRDQAREEAEYAEATGYLDRQTVARFALADSLKSHHEEFAGEQATGVYSDLLSAALSDVNWAEIAESLLEDGDYFCHNCGQFAGDGEGYDGKCGNCADAEEDNGGDHVSG